MNNPNRDYCCGHKLSKGNIKETQQTIEYLNGYSLYNEYLESYEKAEKKDPQLPDIIRRILIEILNELGITEPNT